MCSIPVMAVDSHHGSRSTLLLLVFALASVAPVAHSEWRVSSAAVASLLMVGTVLTRDWKAVSPSLFCAILLVSYTVNPLPFWPFVLLVPLAVYAFLVGAVPQLRRVFSFSVRGRLDRGTVILMIVTVLGSSAALVIWFRLLRPDVSDLRRMIPVMPIWALPLAGLGFAIVNAVLEEYIWRGILWDLLSRAIRWSPLVILLQAGSFGLFHIHGFPRGWIGVGMASLYGVLLGLIRHRARGLGPPIIAHVFADLTIFVILLSMSA